MIVRETATHDSQTVEPSKCEGLRTLNGSTGPGSVIPVPSSYLTLLVQPSPKKMLGSSGTAKASSPHASLVGEPLPRHPVLTVIYDVPIARSMLFASSLNLMQR